MPNTCMDCGKPLKWGPKRCQPCWLHFNRGENHSSFLGDAAKNDAKRKRAVRMYPLGPCELCGETARDRHHIDGDTGNNEQGNIQILCPRCHAAVEGGTPEEHRAAALRDGKLCRRCEVRKPAEEFSAAPKHKDKLHSYCKACVRVIARKWRQANSAEIRLREKKQRLENPEQEVARRVVAEAIRIGSLTRPSECSRCGKHAYAEAHHFDYDKPLEVEWVCASCHRFEHHPLRRVRC